MPLRIHVPLFLGGIKHTSNWRAYGGWDDLGSGILHPSRLHPPGRRSLHFRGCDKKASSQPCPCLAQNVLLKRMLLEAEKLGLITMSHSPTPLAPRPRQPSPRHHSSRSQPTSETSNLLSPSHIPSARPLHSLYPIPGPSSFLLFSGSTLPTTPQSRSPL